MNTISSPFVKVKIPLNSTYPMDKRWNAMQGQYINIEINSGGIEIKTIGVCVTSKEGRAYVFLNPGMEVSFPLSIIKSITGDTNNYKVVAF